MNSTYAFPATRQRLFVVATGMVAMRLILAGVVSGQTQTWIGGSGNWSNPINWTPFTFTVPNSPSATANFISGPNSVNLGGGSFIVGTLNDLNGGFTFLGGTLVLAGSATINAFSGNTTFLNTLVLGANATIDTAAPDSTVTILGTITGAGLSLTKTGPGTLTLTTSRSTFGGDINVNLGTLTVQGASTVSNPAGNINVNFPATLTIQGASTVSMSQGNTNVNGTMTVQDSTVSSVVGNTNVNFGGTLTVQGNSTVSSTNGSTNVDGGTLTIQGVSTVSDANGAVAGAGLGGKVIVDASSWTNSSPVPNRGNLDVGQSGAGTLTIQNGGKVSDSIGFIADQAGSTGTVTVTDPLSIWANSEVDVGFAGTGTLTIQNGGVVSDADGAIGLHSGSNGTVTVTDPGSTWTNSGNLFVGGSQPGAGGAGLLQISNGGTVSAAATTIFSTGTLAIGSSFTLNSSSLTIDGGTVRTLANTTFPNSATLGTGGTIFDSNGFNSTFSGAFMGPGGITKISPGTVTLRGANAYAGGTTIDAGTLNVSADHNLGSPSGGLTFSGGTLQFGSAFSLTGTRLITLIGSGTIDTNGFDTTITQAIIGAGHLSKTGAGTLTLTGANTYSGGTTISAGTLRIGSGGANGSIPGNVINNGVFAIDRSGTFNFGSLISGTGSFEQRGAGTTILSAANTYTGGTTLTAGTLNISADDNLGGVSGALTFNGGKLQFGSAFNLAGTRAIALNAGNGTIDTNGFGTTITQGITGAGGLSKGGAGALTLSGTNTYSGNTNVNVGTLLVDGSLLGTGSVNVVSGATLGGRGTIAGPVTIQNGGILAPGDAPGTLAVGTLTLNSGSILNYKLGIPNVVGSGVNDLVNVNGNLTLAGKLNVSDLGGFGSGVYRLFNYTGSLTNNVLTVTSLPNGVTPSDVLVQTTHPGTTQPGEVNLLVSSTGFANQYWDGTNKVADGTIHGGTGSWDNTTTNWTNKAAAVNAPWQKGFVIFEGTAGTVTLGDNIQITEMEFMTDGYTIVAPGTQTLEAAPVTIIHVDQGVVATISAPIVDGSGPAAITKTDSGTLILKGTNSFTGGTTITSGTLKISADNNLGGVFGGVTFDGGTLQFGSAFNLAGTRAITLNAGGGTIDTNGFSTTITQALTGAGGLSKTGAGTLTLTGTNTYTGGTTITAGILQLGNGGSIVGDVLDNGSLIFNPVGTLTISGLISGGGTLQQNGAGTTSLTGDDTYAGGTTINAGTLKIGNGGTTGSIVGDVTDNAALAFDRSDSVTFSGIISGNGRLSQSGSGALFLTGNNTYAGGTTISAGALQLGNGGASGSILGDVVDNSVFAINRSDTYTFAGNISGAGAFEQLGSGTTLLAGSNNYSGGTTITAGTLNVSADKNLGNPSGGLTFGGGTLQFGSAFDLAGTRVITLNAGGGTIDTNGFSTTITQAITGAGGLSKKGTGRLILTGANVYTGGTVIAAGTLQLGNGGTAGSVVGDVVDNGSLVFDRADALTFGGAISGTGSVQQNGVGTTALAGNNTYTGGTTINAGTLQIGSGGTIGSIVGNVTDNANLVFDRSDTVTFSGTISGTGRLAQSGTGSLILIGTNTYSGGTTINVDGTLQIGNGGRSGSLVGDIVDNGSLVFDRAGALTFGGVISGTGSVQQNGSGTLILAGSNTYSGGTILSNGILTVGSSQALGTGNVMVNGGTLNADPQPIQVKGN